MEILHDTHQGVSAMKAKARAYVWWPNLDKDIEDMCKACQSCGLHQHRPQTVVPGAWPVPSRRWSRLHLDHAGPFQGHIFLLVVDAYSHWLEVVSVPSTSAENVIQKLRISFATHGLPDLLVTDNASAFTSDIFQDFCAKNGIRHVTTAPGHPSSNGLVERAVQTFKQSLRKVVQGDWVARLASFLLQQHSTPHSSTGVSPAELLMNRRIKTHLDCFRPSYVGRCEIDQDVTLSSREEGGRAPRTIALGDSVWASTFCNKPKWFLAVVTSVVGPRSFMVKSFATGKLYKRHLDHLVHSVCVPTGGLTDALPLPDEVLPSVSGPAAAPEPSQTSASPEETAVASPGVAGHQPRSPALPEPDLSTESLTDCTAESGTVQSTAGLRRSSRRSRPVDRLNL